MAELGLSHWTEEKVVEPVSKTTPDDDAPQKEYVLRPLYQRLPFAGAQLFLGNLALLLHLLHFLTRD